MIMISVVILALALYVTSTAFTEAIDKADSELTLKDKEYEQRKKLQDNSKASSTN